MDGIVVEVDGAALELKMAAALLEKRWMDARVVSPTRVGERVEVTVIEDLPGGKGKPDFVLVEHEGVTYCPRKSIVEARIRIPLVWEED